MSLSDVPYRLRLRLLSAGPRGVARRPQGGEWEIAQADAVGRGDEVVTQADLLEAGAPAVMPEVSLV